MNPKKSRTPVKIAAAVLATAALTIVTSALVRQMPAEVIATLLGFAAGLLAGTPLTTLIVFILEQKWSRRTQAAVDAAISIARQARAPAEPRPFVIVQPPVQQAAPGTVRTVVEEPLPRERHFTIVGRDGNGAD